MSHEEDAAWERYDLAIDGVSLPPDLQLRGPVKDPGPTCPVIPLGERDGLFHFLDPRRAYRVLSARQLGSHAELLGLLLGVTDWLWECFTRYATRKIDGELRMVPVGYVASGACSWLMAECARQPMFGPQMSIRRAGIWAGESGEPVAHCGDALLIDGEWEPAGLRTPNIIWPADPPVPRPGNKACDAGTTRYIQSKLQEYWRFRYGGGAIVVLGWLGGAVLGALPRWRPNIFLAGDPGSGKSKLLETLRVCSPLHSYTTDTTAAGLQQQVTNRAHPCLVDEASDQVDQRGAQTLLNMILASTAADGGKVTRGTPDGKGRTADIIGAVAMASVAPPEMQPQHAARIALVELLAPEAGADHLAEMDALIAYCREQGPGLWRRALDGYKRYLIALAVFRDALGRAGCAPRQQDQLGALLSGWWTLTDDGVPDERQAINGVAAIVDFVARADEVADQSAGRLVAEFFASSRLEGDRSSEKWPVAEMCMRVWETKTDPQTGERVGDLDRTWQDRLGRNGMRAIRADQIKDAQSRPVPRGGPGDGLWLAHRSEPVAKMFDGTQWAGQRFRYLLRSLSSVQEATGLVRIGDIRTRAAIWISRADLLGSPGGDA